MPTITGIMLFSSSLRSLLCQALLNLKMIRFCGELLNLTGEFLVMSYIPNTPEEQQAMLEHMGLSSIEDLLAPVPADVRIDHPLNLPPALSEPDLKRLMSRMAARNKNIDTTI